MDYKEQYERWVKYADEATKKELLALTDEREIEDRFRCSMQFGTGGLRGVLGAGTNRMNIYTVRKATQGYADFVKQQGDTSVNRGVAIAYDNRWGSKEFAENTAGVLAANGIKVYLFESLRPTPELSFAVRELRCFGGVMITASHNPPRYNGYKLYDETGCQLVPRYTDQLIRYIDAVEDELHIACLPLEEAGARIEIIGKEVDERYYQKVRGILFEPDIPKNIKIVFSPQHGTGNVPIRRMLDDLGYAVLPVEEQCAPDPAFSNTKTQTPKRRRHLRFLWKSGAGCSRPGYYHRSRLRPSRCGGPASGRVCAPDREPDGCRHAAIHPAQEKRARDAPGGRVAD